MLFPADRPLTPAGKAGRSVTIAPNGMVATSHPLAAQVGLDVLKKGGNAVDAAIATSAAMGLMEPMSCGIGGDLFAIVWDAKTQKLYGLNASGRAPARRRIAVLQGEGTQGDPDERPAVLVRARAAWTAGTNCGRSSARWRFKELLAPSIDYAEKGVPVPEVIAGYWRSAEKMQRPRHARDVPDPRRQRPALAARRRGVQEPAPRPNSYRQIADGGRDAFYKGEIAEKLVALSDKVGGLFSMKDFADHTSEWVEPVKTTYRGYDVWETPAAGPGHRGAADAQPARTARPQEAGAELARLLAPARRGEEARLRRPREVLRRPGVREGAGRRADLEGVRRRARAS